MICEDCIHNVVCEREHFENHCDYKHTKADIINPELKKIKTEIMKKQEIDCNMNCNSNKCGWYPCADINHVKVIKKDITIINRHISKLKRG